MKLTGVLLIAVILQVSATTYGQAININVKNANIQDLLLQIQQESGYDFLYSSDLFKTGNPVTLNVKNASINEVMEKCMANQPFTYVINNKTITIRKKVEPAARKQVKQEQPIALSVTGNVADNKGQPIPGVVVRVKEHASIVTTTDMRGNYKIMVPDNNSSLIFSFIGYDTQEILIKGKTVINITLTAVNNALDEVVVVAYGSQKRASITGAVSTINPSEIKKGSVTDITNSIVGRTPGIRVTQTSSLPGRYDSQIDIRGYTGAGNTGSPLFVIDGVPRDKAAFDHLDPNEIESFSVLKDATAAIYGVQAANGVILITTKKGQQGKTQVTYTGQWGAQFLTKYPTLMDSYQEATTYDEMQFNNMVSSRSDPITPKWSQPQIADFAAGKGTSVDWIRQIEGNRANQQQHNVTISGGTDKIKFFTSGGYIQEGGLLVTKIENSQKYNVRQSFTDELAKGLTLDINLGYVNEVYSQPNTSSARWYNLLRNTWGITPQDEVYLNGDPRYFRQFDDQGADNPMALITRSVAGYDDYNDKRLTTVSTLNYAIPFVPGLNAKVLVGYDNTNTLDKNFVKSFNQYQFDYATNTMKSFTHNDPSSLTQNSSESYRNDTQFSLNYSKHINKHNISALALYEQIYNESDNTQGSINYVIDALDLLDAGNLSTAKASGGQSINSNRSFVGRVNYDYEGKYLLEGGFRDEGSSYFPANSRWGFFPYASAGWRISEEPFIKGKYKWIDNIKLRASYGKLGDDASASGNNFPAFLTGYTYPSRNSLYSGAAGRSAGDQVGTVFGPSGGITKGVDSKFVANTAITWYSSTTTDIGLETSFWNGALTFEGDVFRRDRSGLLAQKIIAIPGNFGATLPVSNINSDRTQGIELTLGTHQRAGELIYNISANAGFTRSEWRHYEQSLPTNPWNAWGANSSSATAGQLSNRYVDFIRGYVVNGQFQNQQQINAAPAQDGAGNHTLLPGDLNYVDINGDGVINGLDQRVLDNGGQKPLIYFGTTIDAQWKAFDVSILIQGATDYHINYTDAISKPFVRDPQDPITTFFDRWHHEDLFDQNSPWIPGRWPSTGARQNRLDSKSTFTVFDGTYARLKQFQIGYTIPKKWVSKVDISRVRLFASGYDVLTWHAKGLDFVDPEYPQSNSTTSSSSYSPPLTMNLTLGVQITF